MTNHVITIKNCDERAFANSCNHHIDKGYKMVAAGFAPLPYNSCWWAILVKEAEKA